MSLLQFSGLFVVWLLCTLFIATLTWFEFRRVRFNFNVFFSLLFLLTFFFGFPLTSVLVFRFDVGVAPPEILLQALLSAGCFYAVYYVTYKTRLRKRVADVPRRPLFTMNRVETNLTWVILMGIALVAQLAGDLCREAGMSAAATAAELCGRLLALLQALPLLQKLLSAYAGYLQ